MAMLPTQRVLTGQCEGLLVIHYVSIILEPLGYEDFMLLHTTT
jgi:hypothetical protein